MQRRLEGASLETIAAELGVARTTVLADIKKMLSQWMRVHEAETIPQLRAQELQRIDTALVKAYEILNTRAGTELALKAVDRILRAVNLRAELLGLKVPIEVNLKTMQVTQMDLELAELVRGAEQLAESQRLAILGESAEDGRPAEVA